MNVVPERAHIHVGPLLNPRNLRSLMHLRQISLREFLCLPEFNKSIPRIENRQAQANKIFDVACDQNKIVFKGRRGDQAVWDA